MRHREITEDLISECKRRLLSYKQDLLNRVRMSAQTFAETEKSGDEIDQTVAQLEENRFLITQDRLRQQLIEVEYALARIEQGTFGRCEETEEFIEADRLLAIPWTRLSIEGAEIREALSRKFARV